MELSKVCTKCGVDKPLSDYNKHKQGKHGRRSSCRLCQNAENKAYKQTEQGKEKRRQWKRSEKGKENERRFRENNKEKIRTWQQRERYKIRKSEYRDEQRFDGNRLKALDRDNHQCVNCKSKKQLQVHHKDQRGRNTPKEEQNHHMDNLITLCARCHINKHNPVLVRWGKGE